MSSLLAPLLGACLFLFLYLRRQTRPKPIPNVPHLPGILPFFGQVLDVGKHYKKHGTLHTIFLEICEKTGSTVLSQVLMGANTPLLLTSDPDQIDKICFSKDWDRGNRSTSIFEPLIPHALLALQANDEYRAHKRAFAFGTSSPFLKETSQFAISDIPKLMDVWAQKKEGWFDPEPELTYQMARVISGIVFGSPSDSIDHDLRTLFKGLAAGPLAPIQRFVNKLKPENKAAYRRIDDYVKVRTQVSRAKMEGGEVAVVENLIDGIVQKELKDGVPCLPADGLRDELISMVLAGDETTVTSQLWILKFLSNNPEVQHKLRQYLRHQLEPLDTRPPTMEDLLPTSTPYLEAVLQEVLRLGTPVPLIGREAMRETVIFGPSGEKDFVVQKGTKILMSLGPHGHKDKDMLNFKPERWLDGEGNFVASSTWQATFAKGPRMCWGYKLALMNLRFFLVYLSDSFFLEKPPPELQSATRAESVTLRPTGFVIRLRDWAEVEKESL